MDTLLKTFVAVLFTRSTIMKICHGFQIYRLVLGVALSTCLSFASPAFAIGSYIINLDTNQVTKLGTLSGSTLGYGINDAGQVVGYSVTPTGAHHAFITGSNGIGITDLGTLGGGSSEAY